MRHHRPALLVAALAALAACSDQGPVAPATVSPEPAPLRSAAPGRGIEGSYLVVLREGADPRAVAAVAGVEPGFVYAAALNGFSAKLNAGQLNALRHDRNVAFVEEDQVVEAQAVQSPARWGLDRIDQKLLPLNNAYSYNSTGAGVRVYVIDTGIDVTHPEFGGRAVNLFDALGGSGADCNGHGTHVAGVVGSVTYGVAKRTQLRGIRALNCSGSGSTSQMIAAVDWVRLNHVKPAVANLSIGGSYSAALNTAVSNLISAGVFTTVAAGNSASNACNYSPGSVAAAFTVAGSTPTDNVLGTSNSGSCVDGYAPASAVSTWLGGGTANLTGSSIAAPHAAGVAALYLDHVPTATPAAVTSWIVGNMTAGVLIGVPTGTPNRLLFKSTL